MELVEKAICFAAEKHSGMVRKIEGIPYILHPMEVAAIIGSMTRDEAIIAAGILHDTVEDTDTTRAEIMEEFGPRVAELVAGETEDKRPYMLPEASWRIRKEESLAALEKSDDIAEKILWMGDKLSNIRSIYRLWKRYGDGIWENFNQKDPAEQAWYYKTVIELLSELDDHEAYKEYKRLVEEIFG